MFYNAASHYRKNMMFQSGLFQYTPRIPFKKEFIMTFACTEVLSFSIPDFETLPFGKTLQIKRAVLGYPVDLTIRKTQQVDAEGLEFGFGVDQSSSLCPIPKDYIFSFNGVTLQFKTKAMQRTLWSYVPGNNIIE